MNKKFLILILSALLVRAAFSGTTGAPFYYLDASPADLGFGNIAFCSKSPSVSANPAGLRYLKGGYILLGNGGFEIEEVDNDIFKFDLAFTLGNGVGVGFGYFNQETGFDFVDGYGNTNDSFSHQGEIATFHLGFPLSQNFSMGIGLQNVAESFLNPSVYENRDYGDKNTIFNMGFLWKPGKFFAGLNMFNLGEAEIREGEKIPSGAASTLGWEGNRVRIAMESVSDQQSEIFRMGFEWSPFEWFSMRTGLEQENDSSPAPTAGCSLLLKSFVFDFGAYFHENLGVRQMASVKYRWGGKAVKSEEGKKPAPAVEKAAPAEILPFEGEPVKKVKLQEVPAGEKLNIAVTDFEARAPLSQSDAAFISDFVRSDLVNSDVFNVIEKNNMDKVLAEQGFQQTGCSSAECAVRIGKILNVKYMSVGSCGQLLGKYIITINVVDVESAKIIYSDDISVADPDALRSSISSLVKKFYDSIK